MLKRWTMPNSYFGATWKGYYCFLSQNRDSDILERSNFDSALVFIGGESSDENGVQVVREGHWAVGWIEWIAIPFGPSVAFAKACEIMEALEAYPILDEELYSEMEMADANSVWEDCYDETERVDYIRKYRSQFEFHNWAELRSVVRGEYFPGYASELLN